MAVMPRILPSNEPAVCLDWRVLETRLAKERGSRFGQGIQVPGGISRRSSSSNSRCTHCLNSIKVISERPRRTPSETWPYAAARSHGGSRQLSEGLICRAKGV